MNVLDSKTTHTNRIDNFLNSYHFYSNSIDFRIQSSKAIEKYKNVQSFQLNQITNGQFFFKKDRKEILLLKYDMWTRWIYEVENYLIEMSNLYPKLILEEEHVDFMIELSEKTCQKYKDIMTNSDKQFFDPSFVEIWLSGHELSYEIMIERIKELNGHRFDIGFNILVDNIIETMQYTLIELHELNGLYQHFHNSVTLDLSNLPFLIFTDLDKVCKQFFNKHLIIRRLKVYKKYFDIKELYIKNYSNNRFDPEIFDKIEELGIKINYRLNF